MARGPGLTIDRLRRDGQTFMEDVSREIYLSHSGHKATAELQPIYDRHAGVLAAMPSIWCEPSSAGPCQGRRSIAPRACCWNGRSSLKPGVHWPPSKSGRSHGNRLPSCSCRTAGRCPISVRRSRSATRPIGASDWSSMGPGADLVSRELAPIRRERLERERDYIEGLDVAADYNSAFQALSGIALNELVAECRACLDETQAMWEDLLPAAARRSLGVPVSELTRADALALFRAREFDQFFPAKSMQATVGRQMAEMGVDAAAGGRIYYDTDERQGKWSRAFCSPVRIPDEVYLVMRPHGGQTDYQTLLHELGHAMHFAHTRADLPFEYRWAGDNSVTESYAMLFDHLMQNPGWLTRYTGVGRRELPQFLRAAALEELQYLRRYCAKLITKSSCMEAACHGRHCRISTSRRSALPRCSGIGSAMRSLTWTLVSTPHVTCAPGSSGPSSPTY